MMNNSMKHKRLRGDDELESLLSLMGQSRETVANDVNICKSFPNSHIPQEKNQCTLEPEKGWNVSIWNSHVENTSIELKVIKRKKYVITPQIECFRQEELSSLRTRFTELSTELALKLKNESFEKWHFGQKLYEMRRGVLHKTGELLLPHGIYWDTDLEKELQEFGGDPKLVKNALRELQKNAENSIKMFRKRITSAQPALKHAMAKKFDEHTWTIYYGKRQLRINTAHFSKLYALYNRHNRSDQSHLTFQPTRDTEFHNALFICLLRYESLQGGGFQAAVSGDVFDVLLSKFGVNMECFASPFNSRYSKFCTAFPDTDSPFGGICNFFDFYPTSGSYQANPPFIPDLVKMMATHMENLLASAEKQAAELCFVVVIQAWDEKGGPSEVLEMSKFMRRNILLKQKEHGYCEGRQQVRKTRYRIASAPTIVYFLQTSAAEKRWPATDSACETLRTAFASRQADETSGSFIPASSLSMDKNMPPDNESVTRSSQSKIKLSVPKKRKKM